VRVDDDGVKVQLARDGRIDGCGRGHERQAGKTGGDDGWWSGQVRLRSGCSKPVRSGSEVRGRHVNQG